MRVINWRCLNDNKPLAVAALLSTVPRAVSATASVAHVTGLPSPPVTMPTDPPIQCWRNKVHV